MISKLKHYFDTFFFRGRYARESMRLLSSRLDQIERHLPSGENSAKAKLENIGEMRRELSVAIPEVIAALEIEREFIRNQEQRISALQSSHRGDGHTDLWLELDSLWWRLDSTLSARQAEQKKTGGANE